MKEFPHEVNWLFVNPFDWLEALTVWVDIRCPDDYPFGQRGCWGPAMKRHHVCVVETSPLFGSALSNILRRMGMSVTLHSPFHNKRQRRRPDVYLLDVVTYSDSPQRLEGLVETCSKLAPVLILAREDRIEQIISGLRAGAVGFVKQTASPTQLRKAITAVAEGFTWCDPQLFQRAMKYLPAVTRQQDPTLTGRETDVLSLLSRGESNKEIASHLRLTEQTIKVYVSNLFKKTGASNRSKLAMYALTHGLATPG